MQKVKQITLAARPTGLPDVSVFRFDEVEMPAPGEGELRLKGLYYSVDPYMRGRMNDAKSYIAPFKLNKPLEGGVVAEVLESKDDAFRPGDQVVGSYLPWAEEMTVPANAVRKIDTTGIPASYYLGVLGMPGLTAYFGLMDIGKPKAGETLVVSGAAGAVGLVVGQLGRHLGCHVVGIAGTDEKTTMLVKEYGFNAAVNYHSPDLYDAIRKACPNGIDVYFDNVGGEVTDAVFPQLNTFARVPLCGQISMYNATKPPIGPRVQPIMVTRSILMQGFIIFNYASRLGEGVEFLTPLVREGKIKFTETIVEGFDQLPEALLGLFTGKNTGKMLVKA
ncbi:NADP-dependent oxidoreductase [Chitinophaga lutea]